MKGFLSLSPPSPDGYFIRPSCITLRSPPYRRRPAKFFIGENQRHQRVVRARRKYVSSPDVLSLSLSRFVSRVFQGMIVSPKTIILFLVVSRGEGRKNVHPLFTVHISKESEASSFQLNRLPITCYYSAIMYIRDTGTETKLLQKREGGGDVIDSLAGALRNDFSKPRNVF